jgi:phenylacetic acid degradation operon negative regulatory protein
VDVKARSLVFDLFGDYLRYRGGEVRLRALVALLDCFGIPEATGRVAAARLRKEGWLAASRTGRETVYSLTPGAWQMLDEGRARIFHHANGPWDGQWHMVIYQVPETERALREQLRRRLAWLGFGPLSPSVWLSPHDRIQQVKDDFAASPAAQLDTFRSRSAGNGADRDIAARAWDLAALMRDYRSLLDRYAPRLPEYQAGGLDDREALVERMRLIYDYRHFPFRDPGLPSELLPDDWPGRQAHDFFLQAHGLLRVKAEGAVDAVLGHRVLPVRRHGRACRRNGGGSLGCKSRRSCPRAPGWPPCRWRPCRTPDR